MNTLTNFNDCVIEKAVITTYDGREIDMSTLIAAYAITESIENVALSITFRVIDTAGYLENIPFMGEERMIFTVRGMDYETMKTYDLFIHRIHDVVSLENGAGTAYKMEAISTTSFNAALSYVVSSFDKSTSLIVRDIFEAYYSPLDPKPATLEKSSGADVFKLVNSGKTFEIETTTGNIRCIVPNYRPPQAMEFLAARSYSDKSTSCMFRFFETADGYNFCSDEYLYKRANDKGTVKSLVWDINATLTPLKLEEQKKRLDSFNNTRRSDTAADIYSGAYSSNIFVIDLLKRDIQNKIFRYPENALFKNTDGTVKNTGRHSKEFLSDVLNDATERKMIFFKDYDENHGGQLRGESYIPEIAANRLSYSHMISSTMMSASIHGRLDISAGDVVEISMRELVSSSIRHSNPQLAGKYIVRSVVHEIQGRSLKTSMSLIKFGWGA